MQEQLVGLNQACEMLGVTDVTIRTWDKEGKLKAVKTPGGHRRWRLSDLLAFQGISQPAESDSSDPDDQKDVILSLGGKSLQISDFSIRFPENNTILLCLSVETLIAWKNKSVLEFIQSLNGDVVL